MHDFKLLCDNFISRIFKENIDRFTHKLNNGEL